MKEGFKGLKQTFSEFPVFNAQEMSWGLWGEVTLETHSIHFYMTHRQFATVSRIHITGYIEKFSKILEIGKQPMHTLKLGHLKYTITKNCLSNC